MKSDNSPEVKRKKMELIASYADALPETLSVAEFVEQLKRGDIIEHIKGVASTGEERRDL